MDAACWIHPTDGCCLPQRLGLLIENVANHCIDGFQFLVMQFQVRLSFAIDTVLDAVFFGVWIEARWRERVVLSMMWIERIKRQGTLARV